MRKRHVPVGWPQRNSRHYRFPLPNTVWEYGLKPVEFVILSFLCQSYGHTNKVVSAEDVAKVVHMTVATVNKYLDALVSKGLITGQVVTHSQPQAQRQQKIFHTAQ